MKLLNIPDILSREIHSLLWNKLSLAHRVLEEALAHEARATLARNHLQKIKEESLQIIEWFISNLDMTKDNDCTWSSKKYLEEYRDKLMKPDLQIEDTIIKTFDEIFKEGLKEDKEI